MLTFKFKCLSKLSIDRPYWVYIENLNVNIGSHKRWASMLDIYTILYTEFDDNTQPRFTHDTQ